MKITFLKTLAAIFLLAGFAFVSCSKDSTDNTTPITIDSSKVTTQFSPSLDLSGYQTIAIADSVRYIDSSSNQLNDYETIYIQTLTDSLKARGFNVVPLSSNPDLVLNISRIDKTSNGLIDTTGYWNNYSTYYNPSLYGNAAATYSNNFTVYNPVGTGVLSFELLDLKNLSTTNEIPIIWNGQIAGNDLYGNVSEARSLAGILLQKSPNIYP